MHKKTPPDFSDGAKNEWKKKIVKNTICWVHAKRLHSHYRKFYVFTQEVKICMWKKEKQKELIILLLLMEQILPERKSDITGQYMYLEQGSFKEKK